MSGKEINDWFNKNRNLSIVIVYSHNFLDFNDIKDYRINSVTTKSVGKVF